MIKPWLSHKVKRGLPSKIQGAGLFALEPLNKDEIIAIKPGHILNAEQLRALAFPDHPEIQIADDLFVGPLTQAEKEAGMLYLNHSCDPNVGMRGDIVFVAMNDIPVGAELTMDYAMIDNQDYKMDCLCGVSACRKIVTGSDYNLPALKKYGPYFSAYIQSKLK